MFQNIFRRQTVLAVFLGALIGIGVVYGIERAKRSRFSEPPRLSSEGVTRSFPRNLTPQERAALVTPARDASDEEKRRHFDLVVPLATRAEFLDITDCLGNPIVFEATQDRGFSVKNSDDENHTLQLSEERFYTVPAGGTKDIVADFGFGPGVYGYGCDNSTGAAGVILVTPAAPK